MDKKNLGRIIKKALWEKQMTQVDLAKKMNVSRGVIAQWVNGNNVPPGDKLIELMNTLDIVSDIFPNYCKKEIFYKSSNLHTKEEMLQDRIEKIERILNEKLFIQEAEEKIYERERQ